MGAMPDRKVESGFQDDNPHSEDCFTSDRQPIESNHRIPKSKQVHFGTSLLFRFGHPLQGRLARIQPKHTVVDVYASGTKLALPRICEE